MSANDLSVWLWVSYCLVVAASALDITTSLLLHASGREDRWPISRRMIRFIGFRNYVLLRATVLIACFVGNRLLVRELSVNVSFPLVILFAIVTLTYILGGFVSAGMFFSNAMAEDKIMARHDESGERVILPNGHSLPYQKRAEHTVLRNGSLATDLIQSSVPRWKMWIGHVFDIFKYLVAFGLAIWLFVEPYATRWIVKIVQEHDVEISRRVEIQQNALIVQERALTDFIREYERRHGELATKAELEVRLSEIRRHIANLQLQHERIGK